MAGNGLLKRQRERQLSLFDTAFIKRQCKSPEGHQKLMKFSVALVLRLATTSQEFCVYTLPDTTDSK